MSLYTDGSPSAWEQWYMDTYGVWPSPQAVTSAQTNVSAPVVAPPPAAAPAAAPAPSGPVSSNPWGSFNGDFQAGLSQDLINWYRQQAASKTGPTYMDPTYGQTWGTMGDLKYFDDPTGRYRITMQDAYSAPFMDEYGRQMVTDKNGNVHPYDPSYTQGFNVWDTQTQMGGAYDANGKYKGALNLKQEIDPADLAGIMMIAAPIGAAVAGAGAGAAGAGAGATGGTGAATGAGITGFGDAGLMYGGLDAAAAGSLGGGASIAGGSALGAGALGGIGGAGGAGGIGGAGGAGGGLSGIGSAIQNLLGGGGGMSWTDWISPALQLFGGLYTSNQAGNAADAQVNAANNGIAENRRQFDIVRDLLAPYVNAGNEGLSNYRALSGSMGPQAQQAAIAALQGTPQYSALTKAGEDAILQNAAATGGLRGGNVQNSLANNREQLLAGLIDQQLGRYGSLINIGQNSAAGTGSAAMAMGNNNANLMQQAGAAQAGGIVAGTNAITNALGGVGGFAAARGWTPYSTVPASSGYGGAGISGGGGFGTGTVYGNQDYGQYF